jgi:hypothetical protein
MHSISNDTVYTVPFDMHTNGITGREGADIVPDQHT